MRTSTATGFRPLSYPLSVIVSLYGDANSPTRHRRSRCGNTAIGDATPSTKNPNGYYNHGPSGLSCPVGVARTAAEQPRTVRAS
ncbi:hypothetical protein GCM10029963_37310 [Micromonospora andamanensis]|nr:hypothetical protein Vwe01_44170 [Micromonospora andamanensis]